MNALTERVERAISELRQLDTTDPAASSVAAAVRATLCTLERWWLASEARPCRPPSPEPPQ